MFNLTKQLLTFFFFSLFFFSTLLTATTISFNTQSITLEKPLIEKNNITFFPIFELNSLLNFSISYNHKFDGYEFLFREQNILIALNTNEVWINHSRHFLSAASFIEGSTLYIPFNDLIELFGFTSTKTPTGYSFITKASQLHLESPPLVRFEKRHIDYVRYKFNKKATNTSLRYKNKSKPLSPLLSQTDTTLYINASSLLDLLGYSVEQTASNIIVKSKQFSYTLPLNSRFWTGKQDNKSWSFMAEAPLKLTPEGAIFIPFSSFFAFFDYSLYFNKITSSMHILDNIHYLTPSTTPAKTASFSPQVIIGSRHKLDYLNVKFDDSLFQYSIQIPHSIAFLKQKKTHFNHKLFHSIRSDSLFYSFEQTHLNNASYGNKQTKITVTLKTRGTLLPKETATGLALLLKKKINSYTIDSKNSMHTITLKGDNIESPTIYKEKNMIILDFPNTLNGLARLKRQKDLNFRAIRSSQLSYTPLKTRVVLDFNNDIPLFTTEKKNDQFIISFKKETVAKTSPKRHTKSSLLYNKVIVIDPGHGGRDPGAVINKKNYEKTYTLDVSKRIQKLLEKDGAFVIMTRESDITRSLQKRIHIANKQKADLFLSFHLNSFSSSKVHGSKTFYYKYKDKKLATHISKQLDYDLSIKNNGIFRNRFFVLRHTSMPATLVEPLFLTNPHEHALIKTEAFKDKLALSIYQGIKNYYKDS